MDSPRKHSKSKRKWTHLLASRKKAVLFATFSMASLLGVSSADATAYSWNVGNGIWTTTTNWLPNGTPGSADTVLFNNPTVNGPETIYLGGNESASSLTFGNTGTTTLLGSTAGTTTAAVNTLTLATGVTVNSGAGAVTIGDINSGAPAAVNLLLSAGQTFTNNSGNTLTIANGVSYTTAITRSTTLTIAGTGNTTFAGAISNGGGTGAALALSMTGSGTLTLAGANTFTGGFTATSGITSLTGSMTSTITASGSTVMVSSTGTVSGAITLNNASTLSLSGTASASVAANASSITINTGGKVTAGNLTAATVVQTVGTPTTATGSFLDIAGTFSGTGTTTVTSAFAAGTLVTSNLTLESGGTISATGSGGTTINGGTANINGTITGGAFTLTQGTLNLDYSVNTATHLTTGAALNLNASAVNLNGNSSQSISQTVASTAVGTGNSTIAPTATSPGAVVLALGGLTRSTGGTLNVSAGGITNSSTSNTNGVIAPGNVAFVVVGTSGTTAGTAATADFGTTATAATASTPITALTYNTASQLTAANVGAAGTGSLTTNYLVTDSITTGGTTAVTGFGAYTLKITDTQAGQSLTIGGTTPVLSVNGAGLLFVGGYDYTISGGAGGGTIRSNAGTGELLIDQYGAGNLTFDATTTIVAGALVKTGGGTLTLNGTNNTTGSIYINQGTLAIGSAAVNPFGTGTTSSVLLQTGATLDLSNAGNVAINALGNVNVYSQGAVNIGANTLTLGSATGGTFSGVISGTGNLVKTGGSTQTLQGLNTYGGTTTLNAGVLNAGNILNGNTPSALGSSTNAASNLLFNGGTLAYTGPVAASTDRLFTLVGDGTIDSSSSTSTNALNFTSTGAIAVSAGATGPHTLTLTGSNIGTASAPGLIGGTSTFAPQIVDATDQATILSKTGGGIWNVSNTTSTYTGGTKISAGRINEMAGGVLSGNTFVSGALGTGPVTVTNGGELLLNGAGTYYNPVSIIGTGINFFGGVNGALGALTLQNGAVQAGAVTLAGNAEISAGGAAYTGNTTTGTITGQISNAAGLVTAPTLTFGTNTAQGGGVITLANVSTSAPNNWTGDTILSDGGTGSGSVVTVVLGASEQIPSGANAGNLVLNAAGGTGGAIFHLNNFNETINGLQSTGLGASKIVDNNAAAAGTSILTLGDNNATATFGNIAGSIIKDTNTQSTLGILGITKIGTGTQTFAWVTGGSLNSYTGPTTVQAGTLASSGTGNTTPFGASAVTVYNGATLDISAGANTTINSLTSNAGTSATAASVVLGANSLSIGNSLTTTPTNFAGVISGTGGVTKTGTSVQLLTGANTYSGPTAITGGVLRVPTIGNGGQTSSPLGTSSNAAANLVLGGTGTLSYTGAASSSDRLFTIGVFGTGAANTPTLDTGSGGVAFTTTGNIAVGTAANVTLTLTGISGTSSLAANLTDQTFATTQSFSLTTTSTSSTAATVTNASGLYVGEILSGTNVNAGTYIAAISGTNITLSQNAKAAGAATDTATPGVVGVAKSGGGTWVLSGANTYSGATTLSGGGQLTLDYSTNNVSHLSDTAVLNLNGGTLDLSGGGHTEIVGSTAVGAGTNIVTRDSGASQLTLNALTRSTGSALNFTTGNLATAAITTTNSILGAAYTVGTQGSADWATNAGTGTAITAYSGYTPGLVNTNSTPTTNTTNYFLTGSGTYTTAAATPSVYTLKINSATGSNQSLTLSASTVLSVVGGGILYTGSDNYAITGGSVKAGSTNGELVFSQYGSGTLTVTSPITTNGANALTKTGPGTLALSGGNSYSAGTYITQGNLQLTNTVSSSNASATGTGAVTLNGGVATTLSGTGNTTGLVTATNGSRIAPGINTSGANNNFGSAGTLTLGTNVAATPATNGLTLTNANLDFDLDTLAAGTNDRVVTKGALTLGAVTFTFNELTAGSLQTGTNYTLITGATSLVTTNAAISGTVIQGDYIPTFTFVGNDLDVSFITAGPVPEPGTWAAGFLVLLTAGYKLRRRLKTAAYEGFGG